MIICAIYPLIELKQVCNKTLQTFSQANPKFGSKKVDI